MKLEMMQRSRKVCHRWLNTVFTHIHTYTQKHNFREETSYLYPIEDSTKRSISRSHGFGLTPAGEDLIRSRQSFSMDLSNDCQAQRSLKVQCISKC